MNKKLTAATALALATGVLLTGCQKQTSSNGVKINTDKFPITDDRQTLRVWAPMHGNHSAGGITSIAETSSAKAMEKLTNVKIEWECAASNDSATLFNLMMASNDLPDIFMNSTDTESKYKGTGAIIPITKYVDTYMPNFKKVMNEIPNYKSDVYDENGNIWGIYSYYPDPNLTGIWTFPLIREDWLKKLNLETPKTQDDWYKVLKAFKENDMNGNGNPNDEIPLTMNGLWQIRYLGLWPNRVTDDFFVTEDNKISYGFIEPGYKKGVEFMRKLYSEKLVDNEFLVQDLKQMERKILTNVAGAAIGGSYNYVNEFKTQLENELPEYDMQIAGVLESNLGDGQQYSFDGDVNRVFSSYGFFITSNAKNPELAARWCDSFFSEEGGRAAQFGIEGETYDMVNGRPTFRDDLMKDENTGVINNLYRARYTFGGDGSYGYSFPHYEDKPEQIDGIWYPRDITLVFGGDEVFNKTYDARKILNISGKMPSEPSISLNVDEKEAISQVMTDVTKFTQEITAQAITGSISMAEFDAAVERVKAMNIDKVIEIYQKAYDKLIEKRGK